MTFRARGPGLGGGRVMRLDRPYGRIGRGEGADLQLDCHTISTRHAYLHLDRRGLFVVDLATRTGLRFNDVAGVSGWLGVGSTLELGGRRLEVLELQIDGVGLPPMGAAPLSLLADAGERPDLGRLALRDVTRPDAPLMVNSELLFLGRSSSCGVRITGDHAARIHAVIVRGVRSAYLIDLSGRGSMVNGRPVHDLSPLDDNDRITLGATTFDVSLTPAEGESIPDAPGPVETRHTELAPLGPTPEPPATVEILDAFGGLPPLPPGLLPAESQAAVLGWMMGVLQATQTEMMRRQDEFQREVVQTLRSMRDDQESLFERHLKKVERIQRELGGLREEIRRRFGTDAPPVVSPAPPKAPPLRIPTAPVSAGDPAAATAWLLSRVNQLDAENRSSWRDLIARSGGDPPKKS